MGKSTLLRFGAGIVALALVCGCAAIGKGPSDEALLGDLLEQWKAAAIAQDIDALMALFSEDYAGSQGDKYDTKLFLLEGKDMGYLDDMEVVLDSTEITIEGGTATAYPLELKTAMSEFTIKLTLTKESSGWLITSMDIEE